MYPPCSAYEAWFVSAALDDDAFAHIAAALPAAAAGRRRCHETRGPDVGEKTIVHVMRHGEVHNPEKILYGRLPGYNLSDRGRRQADAVADWLAHNDIVYVVASPLERAQQTATPIAVAHRLAVDTDARPHRIGRMYFEGKRVSPGDGALRDPRNWRQLRDPLTPSWGEPYEQVAARMMAAVHRARATRRAVMRPCASAISCRWRPCAGR